MATKTPNTKQDQDAAYNPGDLHAAEQFPDSYAKHGVDQLEAYANDTKNKSDTDNDDAKNPTKNIDDTKAKEEAGSGWVNNYSGGSGGDNKQSITGKLKGLKKKGPIGAIIGLLVGGGGVFSMLLAPGIGIVQLKEILTDDLNDQLAATSLRSDHMLRAKLKGMKAAGVCTDAVKIRCKFTTMSKRQVNKLKNAGFEIKTEKTKPFGRERITSMSYTDSNGTKITINDPADLTNAARTNPQVRSALRKAFNPKFAGLSDGIAKKVFGKFKTDKTQKVPSNGTDEDRDKAIAGAVAGEKAGINAKGFYTDPEDGRNYVLDGDGNKVYESGDGSNPDKFNSISEENKAGLGDIQDKVDSSKPGSSAVKGVFTSLGKGLSLTGAIDTACTVYNTARAVSAAAKVARALQLVQFFMVFAVTADRIKSGEAQPGEVAYIGNNLTTVDTEKTMQDESTIKGTDENGNVISEPAPNPHYGKNAFDSEGYKTAAYNEAPLLPSSASQFMVGGALSGKLADVLDTIDDIIPGDRQNMRSACALVQSWWVRTIGLVAGLVSAVGSFGATTALSIGASVAIGFALPFLQAALADIIAGNVVSPKTKGVDAGNANFAGAAALLGSMGQNRGMPPASSDNLKSYMAVSNQVKNEYIAMETYEAQDTPFDVMNQYSFLGSAVRSINPTVLQSTASVSAAMINIPTILGTAFSSIIPHANAAQEFNPDRFKRCEDAGYQELGIDADVFCNPRYYMSNRALNMPTEEALDWMLNNGHIDDEGEPKSDDYRDWIKNCAEREDGWGESGKDDGVTDADIGKDCVNKELEDRNTYFQVYYMDLGMANSMDEDLSGGSTGAGTTTPDGTWVNPAGDAKYTVGSGQDFGPRSSGFHDGIDLAYGGDFTSACSGTIKSIGNHGDRNGGDTNIITIDCGGGIITKYMHYYYRDLADGIKVGGQVSAGTKLAKVGNQGDSTGRHLHYQINQNGKAIDPEPFMKKVGAPLR